MKEDLDTFESTDLEVSSVVTMDEDGTHTMVCLRARDENEGIEMSVLLEPDNAKVLITVLTGILHRAGEI